MEFSLVEKIVIWVIPVLLAITFHEAAHAFVAYKYGDNTAQSQGRLSLNPFRHVELFGTLIVPILLLIVSRFQFTLGWAKPVPINPNNFKNPMGHMAIVALAGPMINVFMALLWGIVIKILLIAGGEATSMTYLIVMMCKIGIMINLLLAFLNLLPIPPLDGSRIFAYLLPPKAVRKYYTIEPYGIFILLILVFTGIISAIIFPMIVKATDILYALLGIS